MNHTHPVARAQDLIDRLKHLTKPIGEAENKDLPAVWNELEDLLVMLASSKKFPLDKKKADTLATVIAAIDDLRKTEKRDADSDQEPGRIDQHRGSGDGDGVGNERRTSSTGHRSTETD
jgi:hypothetical protein